MREEKLHSEPATGAQEIVRFLAEHGHRHVFGLPGSSMVAAFHELQKSELQYVPAIHESIAVAAADAYARIAGSAVTFLYMLPGTAIGLSNLYNAWRDESPLIVLASQQATRWRNGQGSIGEADLVELARPFTRFAREIPAGGLVRSWLEAAQRAATGPPSGPAFLSIPEDVFDQKACVEIGARESQRAIARAPDLTRVVETLAEARHPLFIVGGQVRRMGGASAVEALADRFVIPVAYEPGFNDRLSIAPGHDRCVGNFFNRRAATLAREADFVLVLGARLLSEAHPVAAPYFPAARLVAHVNADPAKLEETRTADWAAACDPAQFIYELSEALTKHRYPAELSSQRRAWIEAAKRLPSADPVSWLVQARSALASLHDALDHGWVVDESVMSSAALVDSLKSLDGRRYLNTTGASLGWGTGAAIGAALASGEPVTLVIGDGALRFGLHGLWTIAALKLPVTIVVLDNAGYGSTRYFEREYVGRRGSGAGPEQPGYLNSDMRTLGPRPADLIRGFGIPCQELTSHHNLRESIESAWARATHGPNAMVISLGFES
jgi:thiamine pyrophosphate-dependent acetolactate synthase large subunit-like protein